MNHVEMVTRSAHIVERANSLNNVAIKLRQLVDLRLDNAAREKVVACGSLVRIHLQH